MDDPRTFGAIAAANSVSDVHAMGGRPLMALSIACYPSKDWPLEILGEILAGGAEALAEAGVPVVGGHTVEDAEMKIGYAVIGTVRPDAIWRNSTARPGDLLYLSKPIGTGILAGAARKGDVDADAWSEAIASMRRLHLPVLAVVQPADVHAATDVTGFGLAGHAAEMARGAGVTLRIRAADVPLLPTALENARRGVKTRATAPNREHAAPIQAAPSIEPALLDVFHDAQTSGGLLLAIAPGSPTAAALDARPHLARAIGVVEPRGAANLVFE